MNPMRSLLPVLALILAGFGLAGCSTTTVEKAAMVITLTEVRLESPNRAVLALHLQNEEIAAVAVAGTTHRVSFDGVGFGEATCAKPFAVPERGAAQFEATLPLRDAGAGERLRALLAAGGATYELQSRLQCEVGDGDRLILSVASRGTLGKP